MEDKLFTVSHEGEETIIVINSEFYQSDTERRLGAVGELVNYMLNLATHRLPSSSNNKSLSRDLNNKPVSLDVEKPKQKKKSKSVSKPLNKVVTESFEGIKVGDMVREVGDSPVEWMVIEIHKGWASPFIIQNGAGLIVERSRGDIVLKPAVVKSDKDEVTT